MGPRSPRLPRVGVSMGDPSGVGPEVLTAALRKPAVKKALRAVVYGDASLFHALAGTGAMLVEVSRLAASQRRPGKPSREGGRAQLEYVRAAIAAAQRGELDALCTAPVSKEQITRAGVPFAGHTELLAEAFGCNTLMLMDGPQLRVALATNHLPLRKVPGALSTKLLYRQLVLLSTELSRLLRRKARIAVCALNPHAGEGGTMGDEELRIIAPALKLARRSGVRCEGPFAADGLFSKLPLPYDVALAMFHDQGLVAAKAVDFRRTVNVTLGLPVPRTSPDHGVAYGLAGRGLADATPMAEALLKAAALASSR